MISLKLRVEKQKGASGARAPVEELGCFKHFAGLLQFGKFAFFKCEFLAHPGNFLFLLADLLKDDLDGSFLDPSLSSGLGGGCGFGSTHGVLLMDWL